MAHTLSYSPSTPVIVTGGASGIGKACAQALAEVGRAVAVWDLDQEKCAEVASAISQTYGVKTVGLSVDVSDLAQIESGVAASRKALGSIGGLVHCAGIPGIASLEQLTAENWAAVLDINLRAEVFILKQLLGDFKANSGSAVVGISSINATLGNALNPAYSASKSGMLGVNRALADELGNHGIRINAVSPGQILTPMIQQAIDATPGLEQGFLQRILLNRLGDPSDVASAVRFLLSDEASYITATELVVDGGNISSQR